MSRPEPSTRLHAKKRKEIIYGRVAYGRSFSPGTVPALHIDPDQRGCGPKWEAGTVRDVHTGTRSGKRVGVKGKDIQFLLSLLTSLGRPRD